MVVRSLIVCRDGGFVRRFFVEMVVFSLIFNRNGGFFVYFSSKWWFFRGFFVEMVVCS